MSQSESETETDAESTDEQDEQESTEAEATAASEVETLATFRCNAGKIRELLTVTALKDGNEPFHDDVYVKVYDDRVETIMAKSNNSVLTNCTFYAAYFDHVSVAADNPVGAVLPIERAREYLSLADEGGTIEISLLGENGEKPLANVLQAEGGLNTRIMLPTAQEVLDRIPESLPERFDDQDRFTSNGGGTHTTFIETTFEKLDSIRKAVELDDEVNFYPITVQNGEFTLEIGTDGQGNFDRRAVWGNLSGTDVEGDDLQNWYNTGFEEVLTTLGGPVQIQVSQNAPMALVQANETEKTVRHVLAQVNMQ